MEHLLSATALLFSIYTNISDELSSHQQTNYQLLNREIVQKTNILPNLVNVERRVRDELLCLSLNIYHEARGSIQDDMVAVGHVTMNRVKQRFWPSSVCEVVWQQKKVGDRRVSKFSWISTIRNPFPKEQKAWERCQKLAYLVYYGLIEDPTTGATHYHSLKVNPYWSKTGVNKKKIGSHVFMQLRNYLRQT